jgi:hypothetical protein
MILATHGIVGSQITQYVPLLDVYSGAAAAYSLRLLRTDYTGSAIKVRRTNLDEMDIGFTSTGELDTTALLSFTGTGVLDNGFITTWYDQSGNGYNATQTTALNQPQIVSAGSVILENGKPALRFDGINDFLRKDFGIIFPQPNTYFTLIKINQIKNQNFVDSFTPTTNRAGLFSASNGNYEIFAGNVLSSNNKDAYVLMEAFFNTTNSIIRINGNNVITGNAGNQSAQPIIIGTYTPVTGQANMQMQELIIYNSDQYSNRTGIESNINAFFSIY